ncbi:Protein kinase-like domain protein [Niveomyces insectorum RCEF 264]|uniref:Protein kinase-like domain protein n=1 Tax=Niveomyces insectorum RCEF 264 TaxID=1081102 RepID=A0A167XXF6_9HYPO|nr:Protein kinase-like domain protein [Niveomyces insectorum RCEF 264]
MDAAIPTDMDHTGEVSGTAGDGGTVVAETTPAAAAANLLTTTTTSPFRFPRAANYDVLDSSFFTRQSPPNSQALPSPDLVRCVSLSMQARIRPRLGSFLRPPVVFFRHRGLVVKYGHQVSVAEAHCLLFLRRFCPDVPVPEVYGWRQDGRQTFLYLELVEGYTAAQLWPFLPANDCAALGADVRALVETWRRLPQTLVANLPFIGHANGQSLLDWLFINSANPVAGPFPDVARFHDWLVACSDSQANANELPLAPPAPPRPETSSAAQIDRSLLPDDAPIVFTHGNLSLSNIIVDPERGLDGRLRIAAIVDWQQAGWYPDYWEVCKLNWHQIVPQWGSGEWADRYLQLKRTREECWEGWERIMLRRRM